MTTKVGVKKNIYSKIATKNIKRFKTVNDTKSVIAEIYLTVLLHSSLLKSRERRWVSHLRNIM